MNPSRRRVLAVLGTSTLLAPALCAAQAGDSPADAERWQSIRQGLFADRKISEEAAGIIDLETPVRAADAAVVPIAIRTQLAQTPERYIRKVWLVPLPRLLVVQLASAGFLYST